MIVLSILVLVGLSAAGILASFYWLLLTRLQPALTYLRAKLHGTRTEALPAIGLVANEFPLYMSQGLRAGAAINFTAVLVVGVASASVLSNLQVAGGSNQILTKTNAWHVS